MCCAVVSHPVMSDSLEPTPWTAALQAPLSTGILQARRLEWVAMPPPGVLPHPGIKPLSLLPLELPRASRDVLDV